jgi:hypothetical protein
VTHWVRITGYCDVPDDDWDDDWDDATDAPTADGRAEIDLVPVGDLEDVVLGPDDRTAAT